MDEKAIEAAVAIAIAGEDIAAVGRPAPWHHRQARAAIAAYREASGEARDDQRLDWLARWIFERKWDGTIGRPCDWYIAGNYRHITQRMKGDTLREAIDTAMRDEAARGGEHG